MGNAFSNAWSTSDSEKRTDARIDHTTIQTAKSTTSLGHDWAKGSSWKVIAADVNDDDDLEDPVERMLKKTGCLEKHYAVQECIAETKDWRQCQQQVQDFKECMKAHKKRSSKVFI